MKIFSKNINIEEPFKLRSFYLSLLSSLVSPAYPAKNQPESTRKKNPSSPGRCALAILQFHTVLAGSSPGGHVLAIMQGKPRKLKPYFLTGKLLWSFIRITIPRILDFSNLAITPTKSFPHFSRTLWRHPRFPELSKSVSNQFLFPLVVRKSGFHCTM